MTMNFYNHGEFRIKETDDLLMPNAGLGSFAQIISQTSFDRRFNQLTTPGANQRSANSDVTRTMMGLQAQGVNAFEEVDAHRDNPSFDYLLQTKTIPSKETLRQRLDFLSQFSATQDIVLKASTEAIQQFGEVPLTDKVKVNVVDNETAKRTTKTIVLNQPIVPLDIDVSPFDNSDSAKEGVSRTYKGYEGYAPNFAYLSSEGFLVNVQLRQGKEHVQQGTKAFIQQAIERSKHLTSDPLCLRMDAGNDALENRQVCEDHGVDFLIKRNLRRLDPNHYRTLAENMGIEPIVEREGKYRYDFFTDENGYRSANRVTVREIDAEGTILLMPEVEVENYWTSLEEPIDTIIELYHQHATCEQFHSELKSDLDIERLPSGKFSTNALVLELAAFTYNILRIIGQQFLNSSGGLSNRKNVSRVRMKTILKRMIFIAARLVTTARQTFFRISTYTKELPILKRLSCYLA